MNLKANKWIYLSFFFLSPSFLYSQGEWNNWYFGDQAAITFSTAPPSALLNCAMGNTAGYPVSISDSSGDLLFYTDGWKVYNANHSVMPNGSGLYQGLGLQIVFSVKKQGADSIYYLFHVEDFLPSQYFGLFYSVIDMSLDGGLGDIVPGQKNITVPGMFDAMDLLTATRHKNNKDVWLVTKKYATNQYASILITASGISSSIVLSNSNAPVLNVVAGSGELHISPDGKILISRYYPQNDLAAEFCSFNTETGFVTPLFDLKLFIGPDQGFIGGCGFSPNSKYLYIIGGVPALTIGGIFQCDVSSSDSTTILNSMNQVYQNPPNPTLILDPPFTIGPDWKLYFPSWSHDSIHVISNPNVQGIGCNVQINAISLEGRENRSGLPQFLQKYKAYIHHTGYCQNDSVHFSGDIWPPADSIHWDFGDPSSGISNFSNLANPVHLFSGPGTYTVELWVRHNDKRTDTTWVTIEFPNPQLGPDRTICTGDSTTFDAGYCAGCTYLWRNLLTGKPVGTSQTFTADTTGLYEVTVTNTYDCTERDTVQLSLTPIPDITNSPLSKTICSGESTNIVLTSSVANTKFDWTATVISGTVTGAFADSGLVINQVLMNPGPNSGIVKYHITPHVGSCIGDTANFLVTVNPSFPVDISIAASVNPVCQGMSVTFTATPVNQGNSPVFQWKVNGTDAGTNSPVFTCTPVNGDQVYCVLTSSNTTCTTNNPATSDTIFMIVNPNLLVSILITALANPVCTGTSVTFTATPTNGGTSPIYQWKVNGVNVGTNSPIYTYSPVNNDVIACILTSNVFCPIGSPATSNPVTMTVNPLQAVSVSIAASQNPVCAGTNVIYTATPTNGGTSPVYQWKVNGINVGTNNPVYSYTPVNNDVTTCVLTSNVICPTGNPATSNPVTMTVNPILPVSVAVTASQNPVCAGTNVTYTATPINGGTSPVYQWKVNGVVVGTNSPVYSYIPLNNDLVWCILTSSEVCTSSNPASSIQVQMVVNSNLPASVTVTGIPNPFCPGVTVSFTATPVNGGTSPAYQWKINGNNTGTNSTAYSYSPQPNDSVWCVMTSNLSCVSGSPATSNKIIMVSSPVPVVTFTRCFDSVTTLNAKPIKLKGGIPLGGTYSGPGVNSITGVFTPSIAGIGTKTITYSYTNVALCSASKTKTIIVQSAPAFTCGNNLTDIRDNKVYPTIQFGSQCWMASNLNYGIMILASSHQRDNCIPEKYCYNDLTGNCELGTANYQWDELMRYDDTPGLQGFCPPGWHIPTEAEWNTLFSNWWNNAFAGAPLKYSGYSGFNALLSGVRHLNVQWDYQNIATFFWSSTPYGAYKAWAHGMNDYDPSVAAYPASRSNAFSIRCLRD